MTGLPEEVRRQTDAETCPVVLALVSWTIVFAAVSIWVAALHALR